MVREGEAQARKYKDSCPIYGPTCMVKGCVRAHCSVAKTSNNLEMAQCPSVGDWRGVSHQDILFSCLKGSVCPDMERCRGHLNMKKASCKRMQTR